MNGHFLQEATVTPLEVATIVIGACLVMIAILAIIWAIARGIARRGQPRETAGLVALAAFFVISFVSIVALSRAPAAGAIPAPPTPAGPLFHPTR